MGAWHPVPDSNRCLRLEGPGSWPLDERGKVTHCCDGRGRTCSARVTTGCVASYTTSHRWSGRRDLNPRPPAPKAGALPGCATSRGQGVGPQRGLEPRPPTYEAGALPVELPRHGLAGEIRTHGLFVPNEARYQAAPQPVDRVVGMAGIEPATSGPPDQRAARLRHIPMVWAEEDSNLRRRTNRFTAGPVCPLRHRPEVVSLLGRTDSNRHFRDQNPVSCH